MVKKLTRLLIPILALSLTSYKPVERSGGLDLVECIEGRKNDDYGRIRNLIGVRDSSMPKLSYGVIGGRSAGVYSAERDSIVFDTAKASSYYGKIICIFRTRHELTHALLNRKSKEIGSGQFPNYGPWNKNGLTIDEYGMKFVSEGLATYIAEGERNRGFLQWPKNIQELFAADQSIHGTNLVTPIMEEFGSRAIPFLLRHYPRGEEIFNPQQWQDSIRAKILRERR